MLRYIIFALIFSLPPLIILPFSDFFHIFIIHGCHDTPLIFSPCSCWLSTFSAFLFSLMLIAFPMLMRAWCRFSRRRLILLMPYQQRWLMIGCVCRHVVTWSRRHLIHWFSCRWYADCWYAISLPPVIAASSPFDGAAMPLYFRFRALMLYAFFARFRLIFIYFLLAICQRRHRHFRHCFDIIAWWWLSSSLFRLFSLIRFLCFSLRYFFRYLLSILLTISPPLIAFHCCFLR